MSKTISTYGTGSEFVTSALMGLGATEQDKNGRFYLDGTMVNAELSDVIAEAIYVEEIFRDGQSVTSKYTTDRKAGAVRVMLDTPIPFSSRTVSYGGRAGTDGNSGVINTNPPLMPADDEFMVYLNQVNDQAMIFPDLSKEYIPLDVMAKKINGYAKRVVEDRSASTLAEIIAYAFYRSLNDGDNLKTVADINADNAYADLITKLNSALDDGDEATGAHTFPIDGRTIIGRPEFVNGVFSRKSGVILTGADLAQSMLREYDLSVDFEDKKYVGANYKGYAMQFNWVVANSVIWKLAEKYLGLTEGALDNVYAIAVSREATAMGKIVDLGVKLIDANEVRGTKAQPLNIWGHEAFRKSFVIGKTTLTNDYLTSTLSLSADKRLYPIAPKAANNANKIVVPVFGTDGVTVVGYREVAEVPKPNGGNIQSGLKQVADVTASVASGAVTSGTKVTLSTTTAGAEIYYTTDGSEPTSASTKYTAQLTVSAATTVKAKAIKAGMVPSDVATFSYTISA